MKLTYGVNPLRVKRGRFFAQRYFFLLVIGLAGCATSTGSTDNALPTDAIKSIPKSVMSVIPPTAKTSSAIRKAANPVPAEQTLCIGGSTYKTVQDDEFSQDTTVNYSPTLVASTPQPNGVFWSSRAQGFASDHSRNNIGVDNAYYTDPSRGFGGYNPFSLSNGALNITAEPVPAPYATASPLLGAQWLSGLLEGPALTYGYVEVSAKVPNVAGFWPDPLWLLGLDGDDGKGDGYEELDVSELFGTALALGTVQQTQIFSPSGSPPANYVRTIPSPNPGTSFHTYGVLWTPSTVRFYIDRIATSPAFPNAANGPANPIIILQVFTNTAWAPPPANSNPQTESLQYYRWYQTSGAGCSPSAIQTATPTPIPISTAAAGVPVVSQITGVISYDNIATMIGQFKSVPAVGDTLVAYLNTLTPVSPPTGWTTIDAPNGNGYFVLSGVVGKNGLASSTQYSFGRNAGMVEVLDITGASQTSSIVASSDPDQYTASFPRTLTVPSAGGLLLEGWGGLSYQLNGFTSIADQIPVGQAEKVLAYNLNTDMNSINSVSFRLTQITSEPFTATQPFTATGTISASEWDFNGDLLWIPPASR